ncbi:hypothetical protein KC19_9G088800, partial [Ceratodon purpureus]
VEDFKLPEMVRDASDVQLEEVDVVVALKPDLGYLAAWRELLKGCHLIVVQGGDFTGAIHVPAGFDDVDVYTRCDMVRLLGPELARALTFTGYGSRGFGYLVALGLDTLEETGNLLSCVCPQQG